MARVNKRVLIQGERANTDLLADVIHHYALAAFPPGGSTCAQASREALQTVADSIRQHAAEGGALISRRQLRLLRSAVQWYCSEVEVSVQNEQRLMGLLAD